MKKIVLILLLIILVCIMGISNINAISFIGNPEEIIQIQDRINNDPLLIDNGIVFGRTIMSIKSKRCGPLQFVNISFENENGEVIKNIKSGMFGFYIVRIPIGRYLVTATKFGFHSSFTYLTLFRFKPFAVAPFKLDKIGWN